MITARSATFYEMLASPITAILFAVVTFLLSLAASYILYRRALAVSRLDHISNDTMIVGTRSGAHKERLEIRYDGIVVPQVVSSVSAFWNNGNQTIRGSEIVDSDPLRVLLPPGAKLLQTGLLASTRDACKVQVEPMGSGAGVLINFDFLDAGDGFTLLVVHSGERSLLRVVGTLRGVEIGARNGRKFHSLLWGAISNLAVAIFVGFFSKAFEPGVLKTGLATGIVVGALGSFLLISVFSSQIGQWLRVRSFPKKLRENEKIAAILPALVGPTA